MTNRRAHEVLKNKDWDLREYRIRVSYLSENPVNIKVHEDGNAQLTPDELEAIAAWMRDPKGVAEGVDHEGGNEEDRRNPRSTRRIALAGDYVQREDGSIYQPDKEMLLPMGELVIGFWCSVSNWKC